MRTTEQQQGTMSGHYTQGDLAAAVNFAAFLGWLAVSAPVLLALGPEAVPLAMLLGLPIAFAACWLVGAPVLRRLMRRPITWWAAAGWGAIISALMSVASIAFGRFLGWQQSRNPNFDSHFYGEPGVLLSDDGILTLDGWWALAQSTALFILQGVVIALIVRAIIGPGRPSPSAASQTPGSSATAPGDP